MGVKEKEGRGANTSLKRLILIHALTDGGWWKYTLKTRTSMKTEVSEHTAATPKTRRERTELAATHLPNQSPFIANRCFYFSKSVPEKYVGPFGLSGRHLCSHCAGRNLHP